MLFVNILIVWRCFTSWGSSNNSKVYSIINKRSLLYTIIWLSFTHELLLIINDLWMIMIIMKILLIVWWYYTVEIIVYLIILCVVELESKYFDFWYFVYIYLSVFRYAVYNIIKINQYDVPKSKSDAEIKIVTCY